MHPFAHGTPKKVATTAVALFLFVLTLSALNTIGLAPDYVEGTGTFAKEDAPSTMLLHNEALPDASGRLALSDLPRLGVDPVLLPLAKQAAVVAAPIEPNRIVIHSIGVDLPVSNPETTEVRALDDALMESVVRYPLSAELNQDGNVFIFGHSSHLPVVKNQMFKAFNDIEKLKQGDTIKLTGSNESHIYRVTSVRQVNANDALIDLSTEKGKRLTLSTCDSFGGKSSRWVVEAEFVGSYEGDIGE